VKWLYLILLNVCNILDAVFTYFYIFKCGMIEVNPIMNFFIQNIGGLFVPFKILVVLLLSLILIKYYDNYAVARWAMIICFVVYSILIIYHFVILGVVLL
jgi:hypothetical protein